MSKKLQEIEVAFEAELKSGPHDSAAFEALRIRYAGKKGILAGLTQELRALPKEAKPAFGQALNRLKKRIESELGRLRTELDDRDSHDDGFVDYTLPAREPFVGHQHPIMIVMNEIKSIFVGLGFTIEYGPEIELDKYNFEAVNIPKYHPARDMQDTFFFNDESLLRTHTSPVQIRTMENQQPPIRMICPGRVYRKDTPDATHSPVFHQVEGLVVDTDITFSDLKGTLSAFVKRMFGQKIKTRFIPSYFPFVEPGADLYMSCIFCDGKGCKVCKKTGWIEILGSGMVHPNLFEFVGYEQDKYTGYAFGMGVDRIAMLLYGVDDLRLFFENDIRFLEQF